VNGICRWGKAWEKVPDMRHSARSQPTLPDVKSIGELRVGEEVSNFTRIKHERKEKNREICFDD
jgi:hypothetical protein